MAPTKFLGELEQITLMAVWHLGGDAYGARIRDEIERWTGRSLSVSSVYVTLVRLEKKLLVRSWLADPTPVRGGKAKRFFAAEKRGIALLRQARATLSRVWEEIEAAKC